ncbi:hypothetical protein MMC16_000186 [Acarospora aff. strigata]|nr:hypothetical protein [Acarospora aff. strigata]
MAGGQKRIAKELAEITKDPPEGITASLLSESDVYKWHIVLTGPENSPYAGGRFTLHLSLPPEYPFKPPTLSFLTKIYHPNISNDDKGSMCLGMLRSDEWKPSSKISAVLRFARQILVEPMPEDAVEGAIAEQFRRERAEFERVARSWVRLYAGGKK